MLLDYVKSCLTYPHATDEDRKKVDQASHLVSTRLISQSAMFICLLFMLCDAWFYY